MTKVHSFIVCLAQTMLFAAVLMPGGLRAQAPGSPPAGVPAHVRFWKTELRAFPGMRLTLKPTSGRRPSVHELGSGGPGYIFNNYSDEPAGRGTLEVFSATTPHPLVSLPAEFAPGAFLTVLLREPEKAGNPPRLEIIDDSHDAANATLSQITVRNFITNLKEMHLTVGENLNVQFVSGDSFLQMRGLKSVLYPIRTTGTDLSGKPFEWNMDADFQQCRHQTLLVYPDPYGRVRPRLIVDGEIQAAPLDKGESQR